jgi:hypothetical protein
VTFNVSAKSRREAVAAVDLERRALKVRKLKNADFKNIFSVLMAMLHFPSRRRSVVRNVKQPRQKQRQKKPRRRLPRRQRRRRRHRSPPKRRLRPPPKRSRRRPQRLHSVPFQLFLCGVFPHDNPFFNSNVGPSAEDQGAQSYSRPLGHFDGRALGHASLGVG